jgi:hypothetical protein
MRKYYTFTLTEEEWEALVNILQKAKTTQWTKIFLMALGAIK